MNIISQTALGEIEVSTDHDTIFVATKGDKETVFVAREDMTPELREKVEAFNQNIRALHEAFALEMLNDQSIRDLTPSCC